MKKLIAVLVALLMLAAVALADTATQLDWAEIEPTLAAYGLEGDFVAFDEVAVQMWIPASMSAVELTEEDAANGYIAYFLDDDETAQIAIVYADVNGMSLEEYAAALPELGAGDVELLIVNGLAAVSYTVAETNSLSVAFATEAGYILEVTMAPVSAEGAEVAWTIVTSSIQAA